MSYSFLVEDSHIYVKYFGTIDGLDIVRLTADEHFIGTLRNLQKVIHDFSLCEEVALGADDMKDIALLSNLESFFSENAVSVVIPSSKEGYTRVEELSQAVNSPFCNVLTAQNYANALTMI